MDNASHRESEPYTSGALRRNWREPLFAEAGTPSPWQPQSAVSVSPITFLWDCLWITTGR